MNEEMLLLLLQKLNIKHTNTLSIPLKANLEVGTQIAVSGHCVAVILRMNNFARNSTNGTVVTPTHFYWGDNQRQEFEVLRGVNSQLIFCTDLSQIQLRCQQDAVIQVMVYTKEK